MSVFSGRKYVEIWTRQPGGRMTGGGVPLPGHVSVLGRCGPESGGHPPSAMSAADCSALRVMDAGRASTGAAPWPPHPQVTSRSWKVWKLFECLAFFFISEASSFELVSVIVALLLLSDKKSAEPFIFVEAFGTFLHCIQNIGNYSDQQTSFILKLQLFFAHQLKVEYSW